MKKLFLLVLMIALAFMFTNATAQDENDERSRKYDSNELYEKFFAATDAKEVQELINKINNLDTQDHIAEMLTKGRAYVKPAKTGWLSLKNKCIDGVSRPYHLFIPEDYDPAKEYWMMFDLHGGISMQNTIGEDDLKKRHKFWGEFADDNEIILAIPTGQLKAEWWSNVGAQNVLGIIDYVKRNYNLNENRVYCAGFSDGGSGSYYMAATQNTPFAGFIPLNGHPGVAQMGGRQIQMPNFGNKQMYVINTSLDSLYPAAGIKPLIEVMKKAGAKIDFKVYDEYGHDPRYLWDKDEFTPIYAWMKINKRTAHPKKLIWETSDPKYGRLHWLNILSVKDIGNNEKFEDYNYKVKQTRVLLGILVDANYNGIGVKIDKVQDDTLAKEMKLEAGDIIIGIDDKECDGMDDLKLYLSKKTFSDKIKVKVKRGDEELEFEGKFPEAKEYTLFNRDKNFGSISAEIKGNTINVKVKNIEKFELYLSRNMLDISKPVIVNVNGTKYFEGIIKPNGKVMLEQFSKDNDRKMVYDNKLEITVKPVEKKKEVKPESDEEDFSRKLDK